MWEGWACYSGAELVNNARAAVYALQYGINVHCTGGPYIAQALDEEGPYTSPDQDDAPWYDPKKPDSKGFLGVVGTSLEGIGGTGASEWTDLLGDGARPGPIRRGRRELAFTATLIAIDRASLSYGLGWLAAALRGDLCGDGCDGDTLTMLAAPPLPEPESDACRTTVERPTRLDFDPFKRADELERTLFRCRLLEGPTVESITKIQGGVTAEVTWTITAGIPYWYHQPVSVWKFQGPDDINPDDFWTAVVGNGINDPWDSQYVYKKCEDDTTGLLCLTPPEDDNYPCPPLTTPLYPTPPRDPCYKGDKYPIGWRSLYRIRSTRDVIDPETGKPVLDPETGEPVQEPLPLTNWLEKSPIFKISGSVVQIRSLLLRWYTNPNDLAPNPDNLDVCSVCAELWLPYLPAHSTLTIDSRTQTATVECVNGAIETPTLYGRDGSVYGWPTLECATGMILEMVIDGRYNEPNGMKLDFQLADRQDAA